MSMAFTYVPSPEIHITVHPRITGVDLVAVYDISALIAQTVLAENGKHQPHFLAIHQDPAAAPWRTGWRGAALRALGLDMRRRMR